MGRLAALLLIVCTGCSADPDNPDRAGVDASGREDDAPDGGSAPPTGTTCLETYVCYGACPPEDDGCLDECYAQESAASRELDDALIDCAVRSGCDAADCLQERCAAEIDACFATSIVPEQPADATVRCDAVGIYTTCRDTFFCTDSTVVAFGFGQSAEQAAANAVTSCTEQMTALVVIGNIGGNVSTKLPCSATECNPL